MVFIIITIDVPSIPKQRMSRHGVSPLYGHDKGR